MSLSGSYAGIVEYTQDPAKLGRVKVRVPVAYGVRSNSGGGYIPTNLIPWALPVGLPAGMSQASGGMDWLPQVGDQVLVRFLDGEPEKPVWEWFVQTTSAAKNFPLHQYGTTGLPSRSALTRYGHSLQFVEAGLQFSTQSGYQLVLADDKAGNGQILLQSGLGQYLQMDDKSGVTTLNVNNALFQAATFRASSTTSDWFSLVDKDGNSAQDIPGVSVLHVGGNKSEMVDGAWTVLVGGFVLTIQDGGISITDEAGTILSLDGLGNAGLATSTCSVALNDSQISITGQNIVLNGQSIGLGQNADQPVVLGNALAAYLQALLVWANTHTHTSGNEGSPTTPPLIIAPPVVAQDISSQTTNAI